MSEKCPCHSCFSYGVCCLPFHAKQKLPKSSLELMRSRYSAYAKHLADYIIETTHADNPDYNPNVFEWTQSILEAYGQTEFKGLEILDHKDKESKGRVTFIAHLAQEGKDTSFQETSEFFREDGKWYYLRGKKSGEIEST